MDKLILDDDYVDLTGATRRNTKDIGAIYIKINEIVEWINKQEPRINRSSVAGDMMTPLGPKPPQSTNE